METIVNFDKSKIIAKLGLEQAGKVQTTLDSQVQHWLRELMPGGIMQAKTQIVEPGLIRIGVPYAHYQNEGIKYVMPTNGKSAFYSPSFGFWSTRGLKKVSSGEPLKGRHHFVEGALEDHYNDILEACKRSIKR